MGINLHHYPWCLSFQMFNLLLYVEQPIMHLLSLSNVAFTRYVLFYTAEVLLRVFSLLAKPIKAIFENVEALNTTTL